MHQIRKPKAISNGSGKNQIDKKGKEKKQAHVEAEGPRRGFSASGWNDILPSAPNAHSSWELDQQSLTNIIATKATIWRSTKTETTHVSPLGLLELDWKNGIFNSSKFSENSVANGGGGGGGGGGGLICIWTLRSEAPDAISAVWYWVAREQLWLVWIEGNDFGLHWQLQEICRGREEAKKKNSWEWREICFAETALWN